MIRNNQFYALDTIVDFRPLGLFVERSAVSVFTIVDIWLLSSCGKFWVCFLPKIILRKKISLNGLNFASKYCSNIWCHCGSTIVATAINMSMYRVDNLRMVISEIISFSYGSSLYKWGSRGEETGFGRGVSAPFAWKNYFCRLKMKEDQKGWFWAFFLRECGKLRVWLFVCRREAPQVWNILCDNVWTHHS